MIHVHNAYESRLDIGLPRGTRRFTEDGEGAEVVKAFGGFGIVASGKDAWNLAQQHRLTVTCMNPDGVGRSCVPIVDHHTKFRRDMGW